MDLIASHISTPGTEYWKLLRILVFDSNSPTTPPGRRLWSLNNLGEADNYESLLNSDSQLKESLWDRYS